MLCRAGPGKACSFPLRQNLTDRSHRVMANERDIVEYVGVKSLLTWLTLCHRLFLFMEPIGLYFAWLLGDAGTTPVWITHVSWVRRPREPEYMDQREF